jgi:hypothetical protein
LGRDEDRLGLPCYVECRRLSLRRWLGYDKIGGSEGTESDQQFAQPLIVGLLEVYPLQTVQIDWHPGTRLVLQGDNRPAQALSVAIFHPRIPGLHGVRREHNQYNLAAPNSFFPFVQPDLAAFKLAAIDPVYRPRACRSASSRSTKPLPPRLWLMKIAVVEVFITVLESGNPRSRVGVTCLARCGVASFRLSRA